jgi:hypothetical protein
MQLILQCRQPVTWDLLRSVLSLESYTIDDIRDCIADAQGSLFEEQKAVNDVTILALPHDMWQYHFMHFEFHRDKIDAILGVKERSRDIELLVDHRLL